MKKRYRLACPLISAAALSALVCTAAGAGETNTPPVQTAEQKPLPAILPDPRTKEPFLSESVDREVKAALERALNWLAAHQNESGSWSDENYPALTALPLWGFAMSGHSAKEKVTDKAVKFLLSCARDNGGIYKEVKDQKGGGLANYNTAICMVALHATHRPEAAQAVLKARKFVAESQHFGGDIYKGGMGYDKDTGRPYTDLMNSVFAYEAMALTADAEKLRGAPEDQVDLDWVEARKFLERMQNKASSGPDNEGGFPYRPDESKAGSVTNEAGAVVFRSYGSMTYAGMLAMIYAKVERDDPRVKSAFDWAAKHWSLEENPGMGPQGLYFFYHIVTKALAAYGKDIIPLPDGKSVNWRQELVKRLLDKQKIEPDGTGYWVNESGRFWESNPILATSYSVLALEIAAGLARPVE